MKGLIIEDDKVLSDNICRSLKCKFDVMQAFDGEEGLLMLMAGSFDFVILDVMMPKLNGYDVISQMRRQGISTPVLMLTALGRASDQVRGLKEGADDYLSKPFDIDVLHARLEALLRRSKSGSAVSHNILDFFDLSVNLNTRTAKIGGNRLELPGKHFDLLVFLLENRNIIVHKERLFLHVWGFSSNTDFSVVEVYASQIRKELKKYGYDKYLKTVRGIGYILTDDAAIYG